MLGATPAPSLSTIDDAFNHYYARTGRVDMAEIGELVGADAADVEKHLADQDLAYLSPETDTWRSRADYLTGDVRDKLQAARTAAEQR